MLIPNKDIRTPAEYEHLIEEHAIAREALLYAAEQQKVIQEIESELQDNPTDASLINDLENLRNMQAYNINVACIPMPGETNSILH